MKFIILIWVFFCLSFDCKSQDIKDTVSISIYADTVLIVREQFQLGENCYLYGDSVDGKQYGGGRESYFKENVVDKNNKVKGVTIKKDSIGISVTIKFDLIAQTSKLLFSGAKNRDGWHPDTMRVYVLNIIKKSDDSGQSSSLPPVGTGDSGQTSLSSSVDTGDDNNNKDNNEEDEDDDENIFTAVSDVLKAIKCEDAIFYGIVVFLVIIVIYLLIRTSILKCKMEIIESEIQKFETNKNTTIEKNIQSNSSVKLVEKGSGLTKKEVEGLVSSLIEVKIQNYNEITQRYINSLKTDYGAIKENLERSISDQNTHSLTQEFDSDNVIYNEEDNSFAIVEKSSMKIFRIYSNQGRFFYTIIDDDSIRAELLSILSSFTACLTYTQISGIPTSVKPITDGFLIKEGNKYIVDKNHLLTVELV